MELLFIEKKSDIIDTTNDEIVGNVLIFENIEHEEIVDDMKVPDYIIIMVTNEGILHVTTNVIPENEIRKYLLDKYTIEELYTI